MSIREWLLRVHGKTLITALNLIRPSDVVPIVIIKSEPTMVTVGE